MSLEINLVKLGEYPNDGTGDDLRTAFEKSNGNFTSLKENVILSAVNVGTGAPVWLDKTGNDLRFRSIKSQDSNLTLSFDSNEIILKVKDFLLKVEDDISPALGGNLNLNEFEINGAGDIDISGVIIAHGFEGVLIGNVFGDVFGGLFGNVNGNVTGQVSDVSNHRLESLANVSSETAILGDALIWDGLHWSPSTVITSAASELDELNDVEITAPTSGQVIQYNGSVWTNTNLEINPNSYDFGLLSTIRSPFDLLFQFTSVDFGSLSYPSSVNFDLGTLGGVTPPLTPTYQLSASSLSVIEGSVLTITLTTTNVSNGTVIPYTITGVTSTDINGASLSGSFIVLNNLASLTLPITADLSIEEETLTLTLLGVTPLKSISITITDFEMPEVFDGGVPSTISFDINLDGGVPATTIIDFIANGGVVISQGLIESTIGGGTPFDSPTAILDGESPSILVTVIVDGGELVN